MEPSEDAWIAQHPSLCCNLWWHRQLERQYARADKAATAELKSTHATIARMMAKAAQGHVHPLAQMSMFHKHRPDVVAKET